MAVWASVWSLGFGGRFRSLRRQRCLEDLFSKAMRSRKDFDTELSVGAGLLGAEFVLGEVVPPAGNTKTVRMVVVSSCSTTRGRFWNRSILFGLVSSRYKVVSVMSVWAGGSIADSEAWSFPPGVSELGLGVCSPTDMRFVGAR